MWELSLNSFTLVNEKADINSLQLKKYGNLSKKNTDQLNINITKRSVLSDKIQLLLTFDTENLVLKCLLFYYFSRNNNSHFTLKIKEK